VPEPVHTVTFHSDADDDECTRRRADRLGLHRSFALKLMTASAVEGLQRKKVQVDTNIDVLWTSSPHKSRTSPPFGSD
jgi:hypothetical protein